MEKREGRKGRGASIPLPRRLFVPGDGLLPPHLAGRHEARKVLLDTLELLRDKVPPAHNVAVHGPRGLGKSVLLGDLHGQAKDSNVRSVRVAAYSIDSLRDLFEVTLDESLPESSVHRSQAKAGLKVPLISAEGGGSVENRLPAISLYAWEQRLAEKCGRKPLLFMVDEAHTLDLGVAKALLNASQMIRSSGAPFALVLAGTPGLRYRLSKAQASFWTRLGPGNLHLGLLSEDEAMEALSVPMARHGIPFDEAAVREMAVRSDGYPYFVQGWGHAAVEHVREHGGRVDRRTVESVSEEVRSQRQWMYKDRIGELREAGLLGCVKALAPAFADGRSLPHDDLLSMIDPASADKAHERLNQLLELGVVQPVADRDEMSAGIPSFMRHLMFLDAPGPSVAATSAQNQEKVVRDH